MMKLRKFLSVAALAAAMMINASAIDLYVDSVKLEPDVPPTVVEGHTLVPLRSIFDALGADLQWDNTTKTAAGSRGDSTISIQVGSPTALVNGEEKILEAPAQVINGSTMVPARFVAEGLNCIVKWDKATDGIYISTTGSDPVIPEPPAPASTPTSTATSTPASTSTPTVTVSSSTGTSSNGGSGNANNFNTYNNTSQQKTSASYVLNTSSHKFHQPSCRVVPKISPKNYATSNSSRESLISQGYSSCGICKP